MCKLPPASDTSLAESTGSTAGIVRVKLKKITKPANADFLLMVPGISGLSKRLLWL